MFFCLGNLLLKEKGHDCGGVKANVHALLADLQFLMTSPEFVCAGALMGKQIK